MNKYDELRKRQQAEFDALPIGAAFGHQQFVEMMKKWDLCHGEDGEPTENDCKQISHIYAGAYIQKKDIPALREVSARHKAEFEKAIAEDETGEGFVYDMFYSELCNHEYGYTGDPEDAIEALGMSFEEIYSNEKLSHALEKAERDIMHWEEEQEQEAIEEEEGNV